MGNKSGILKSFTTWIVSTMKNSAKEHIEKLNPEHDNYNSIVASINRDLNQKIKNFHHFTTITLMITIFGSLTVSVITAIYQF